MTTSPVYLDHAASAPLLLEARKAMLPVLEMAGNPSSIHTQGRALRLVIDAARDHVAALAGADARQTVFTGSATEAITQAIVGGVRAFGVSAVVISAAEHKAAIKAAELSGANVITLPVDSDGRIDVEALRAVLAETPDEKTLLLAVHAVNNETGVVQPLAEIEALVGPTRHVLFVDAVQAYGKRTLDFAERAIDMMAVSAHKIGGPAGVGALFVKGHCDVVRLIPGGGQEQGRRGGTESVVLIAGFGAAAQSFWKAYGEAGTGELAGALEYGIRKRAPDTVVLGEAADRIGSVVCFAVPGLKSSVAMMRLDLAGFSVSSGSACSSGKVGRSHVLDAMGISDDLAECTLRVSLGWSSKAHDIEGFLAVFEKLVARRSVAGGQAA